MNIRVMLVPAVWYSSYLLDVKTFLSVSMELVEYSTFIKKKKKHCSKTALHDVMEWYQLGTL